MSLSAHQIGQLIQQHLAAPEDSTAVIALSSAPTQVAAYLRALITSQKSLELSFESKLQLLCIIGLVCPGEAAELLEQWTHVELNSPMKGVLRLYLQNLRGRSPLPPRPT